MSTDTPIACSLNADELPKRLAEMSSIGRDALRSVSPHGGLRFNADATTRERLEAIVAAESRCCPFLSFELGEEGDELVLRIVAPQGAEPLSIDLMNAFAAEAKAA